MSFLFSEISVDESIEKTEKETLNYLRKLSNLQDLPPTLRSQLANNAKSLSKNVHGSHRNTATKFHCTKCSLILTSQLTIVKITKRSRKKKLCEMKCKGCGAVFYNNFSKISKNKELLEVKLNEKEDKKNKVIDEPKNQQIIKPKVNIKPKKKLSKLQLMLQEQIELDKSSQISTFFDSFAL
ncbi:RNAse P, Rpr2/Rpp21 subunit family-containing protein [Strongyloides ratti]|uniref:RNAse P, Rpr2/Rpp21 subunit family-containing protein n=1 Tax=Strongyloides ratti TaxID=34506 RepID=A0A090MVG3_STRRB|nr:RNAse P, Rpr2/Rpp21 subunit family-containing protein [Strongyloides ratti]CEF62888.1 RNAse P, Rpr2/Rpp21 subunit family-containing protein [Strongyloides ratti]